MAVPKKKTSYSKSRSRRAQNMKLKAKNFYLDEAGNPCLPHRIDSNGMYKGRKIFTVKQNTESTTHDDQPSAIDNFKMN